MASREAGRTIVQNRSIPFLVLCLSLPACAAEPRCPTGDLAPPSRPPAYAVLLTDYASSAIGLLDASGEPIVESWIDSGTRATAVAAGLGGDVALTHPVVPGSLAILERYQADVLTLAPFDGSDVRQIDLRGDDPASPIGHSPNVQDALRIDDRHALVARLNPAHDPRTPELARG